MPHIIVEYPDQLLNSAEIQTMLKTVHQSIADSGLFDESHIKTRAYPFQEFTNANTSTEKNNPYIHIQARIKSGRDADNKKQLGEAVLAGMKKLETNASVITVEIIDMHRDSYAKHISEKSLY